MDRQEGMNPPLHPSEEGIFLIVETSHPKDPSDKSDNLFTCLDMLQIFIY
jgi:hypothetical protein